MADLQVTDLTFSYEDSADLIFDHVSFRIDTDWKLGFIGRNGRGENDFSETADERTGIRGNHKSEYAGGLLSL